MLVNEKLVGGGLIDSRNSCTLSCWPGLNAPAVLDTVPLKQKPTVKPKVKAKTDEEDTDFTIRKPAYQYNLRRPALKPGEKFHSSRRAWLLSAVIPGAGQIYNKRYWKLPIVYGGFAGLISVISFNQRYYNTALYYYKVKLLDLNSLLLPNEPKNDYRGVPLAAVASIKEYYRRNRDLGILGVAALSIAGIVDAYVDSELKGFDVSNKLTMKISPWVGSASGAAYAYRGTGMIGSPAPELASGSTGFGVKMVFTLDPLQK